VLSREQAGRYAFQQQSAELPTPSLPHSAHSSSACSHSDPAQVPQNCFTLVTGDRRLLRPVASLLGLPRGQIWATSPRARRGQVILASRRGKARILARIHSHQLTVNLCIINADHSIMRRLRCLTARTRPPLSCPPGPDPAECGIVRLLRQFCAVTKPPWGCCVWIFDLYHPRARIGEDGTVSSPRRGFLVLAASLAIKRFDNRPDQLYLVLHVSSGCTVASTPDLK
jgi:hypothetical protein